MAAQYETEAQAIARENAEADAEIVARVARILRRGETVTVGAIYSYGISGGSAEWRGQWLASIVAGVRATLAQDNLDVTQGANSIGQMCLAASPKGATVAEFSNFARGRL